MSCDPTKVDGDLKMPSHKCQSTSLFSVLREHTIYYSLDTVVNNLNNMHIYQIKRPLQLYACHSIIYSVLYFTNTNCFSNYIFSIESVFKKIGNRRNIGFCTKI